MMTVRKGATSGFHIGPLVALMTPMLRVRSVGLAYLIVAANAYATVEEEIKHLSKVARVTRNNCNNVAQILSGASKPEVVPLFGYTGPAAVARLRGIPPLSKSNCALTFEVCATR